MTRDSIRILVVAHDAAMGGAQRALLETLRALAGSGHSPVVFVPTPGPFAAAVRGIGIPCHAWGLVQRWIHFRKPSASLFGSPRLRSLVSLLTLPPRLALLWLYARFRRIDLVYSNTITMLDGAFLVRLLGIPHVWHLHEAVEGNSDLISPWPTAWLPRFILAHADRVIVNSDHLRRNLFRNLPQDKVRVVPNGVAIAESGAGSACPDIPGLPPDVPVSAIVGRLDENKRIVDYLAAVVKLQELFPDTHHLVIGDGRPAYRQSLQETARRLGLDRQVHFLGYRDDVRRLMPRIGVLVSASARETFGRTLIEAMAAGVPVVATRSGGPEEIVVDGECGFLVDVGDVADLAERIGRILGDRALAQALGAAGRRRAREHFDLARTTQAIASIVEEALSGRR